MPTETLIPNADGTHEEWEPYPGSESGTDYYMVNSFGSERLAWTETGVPPYLDAIDYPTNTVYTAVDEAEEGDWGFEDSERSGDYVITGAQLELYCCQEGEAEIVNAYAWNGVAWVGAGDGSIPTATYSWQAVQDVSEWINTWAKVNNCKMYIVYHETPPPGNIHVDAGRLAVFWTRDFSVMHYLLVDDPPGEPDDDTTLIGTLPDSSVVVKDTVALQNSLISERATINYVRVFIRGHASFIGGARPEYRIMMRTHDTDYFGNETFREESGYTDHYQDWATNPFTGAPWTLSEINALEVGVQGKSGNTGDPLFLWIQAKVTQVYVVISYSVPSVGEILVQIM